MEEKKKEEAPPREKNSDQSFTTSQTPSRSEDKSLEIGFYSDSSRSVAKQNNIMKQQSWLDLDVGMKADDLKRLMKNINPYMRKTTMDNKKQTAEEEKALSSREQTHVVDNTKPHNVLFIKRLESHIKNLDNLRDLLDEQLDSTSKKNKEIDKLEKELIKMERNLNREHGIHSMN